MMQQKLSSCVEARTIGFVYQGQTHMETLEFIIYPDGRVMEKVTGIVGSSCAEVTAAIEAQLGHVLKVEPTAEYFAQVQQEQEVTTNQATFSQW